MSLPNRLACIILLFCTNSFLVAAQIPTWSHFIPTGTGPVLNSNPAVYDSTSNSLIFFGGLAADGSCCTSDIWILTNANGVGGSPAWQKLLPQGTLPPARISHSAVYDSNNNRLIIFAGGVLNNQCFAFCVLYNDVWVLSNANGNGGVPIWTQLTPAGTLPPVRSAQAAVYDPQTNRMVIFGGGDDGINDLNDTWVLTNANGIGSSPEWIQLSPSGGPPSPREVAMVSYDQVANTMTIFGGAFQSDLWILSNANNVGSSAPTWQQITQNSPAPGTLNNWNYGHDQASNMMIFFGGSPSFGTFSNDVWALYNANGAGTPFWEQLVPNGLAGSPPAGAFLGSYDLNLKRLMITPDPTDLWVLPLSSTPFLGFPWLRTGTGTRGYTPYTAPVFSVFDHSMLNSQGKYGIYACDNTVTAYTEELGSSVYGTNGGDCTTHPGYAQDAEYTALFVNSNYKGSGAGIGISKGQPPRDFLNYDGHPGIDYGVPYGSSVVAATAGIVHYPTYCMLATEAKAQKAGCLNVWENETIGGDPDEYNVLELDPSGVTGYKVFYLHLSTHPRTISLHLQSDVSGQNFLATPGNAVEPSALPNCTLRSPTGALSISGQVTASNVGLSGVTITLIGNAQTSSGLKSIKPAVATTNSLGNYSFSRLPAGYYHLEASLDGYTFAAAVPNVIVQEGQSVSAGQEIALSGNSGNCIGPHLHFEVQQQTTGAEQEVVGYSYIPVDPYGWDGEGPDPYPSITGGMQSAFLWNYVPHIVSTGPTTGSANIPFSLTIAGSGFDSGVVDCLVLKGGNYRTCIHGVVQSRNGSQLIVQETLASGTYFVGVENSDSSRSNWRQLVIQ